MLEVSSSVASLGFSPSDVGIGKPVILKSVKDGSRAHEMNLKPGDEIISVNGVLVATLDKDSFKAAAQQRPLKLEVRPVQSDSVSAAPSTTTAGAPATALAAEPAKAAPAAAALVTASAAVSAAAPATSAAPAGAAVLAASGTAGLSPRSPRVQSPRVLDVPAHVTSLGFSPREAGDDKRVFLKTVKEGSWAQEANLKPGDEIISINGIAATAFDQESFKAAVQKRPLKLEVAAAGPTPPSSTHTSPRQQSVNTFGSGGKAKEPRVVSADSSVPNLGIDCVKEAGKVFFSNLESGSWAELNGLNDGDELLSVNDIAAENLPLEDLKKTLHRRPVHLVVGPQGKQDLEAAALRMQSVFRGQSERRSLKEVGKVPQAKSAWKVVARQDVRIIGVLWKDNPPHRVFVKTVTQGMWADNVGFQPGDELLSLNGIRVVDLTQESFQVELANRPLEFSLFKAGDVSNERFSRAAGTGARAPAPAVMPSRAAWGEGALTSKRPSVSASPRAPSSPASPVVGQSPPSPAAAEEAVPGFGSPRGPTAAGAATAASAPTGILKTAKSTASAGDSDNKSPRSVDNKSLRSSVSQASSGITGFVSDAVNMFVSFVAPDHVVSAEFQSAAWAKKAGDKWAKGAGVDLQAGGGLATAIAAARAAGAAGHQGAEILQFVAGEGVDKVGLSFHGTAPECISIKAVIPGSWAQGAGFHVGDEIEEVNGNRCSALTKELFAQEMSVRPLTFTVARWPSPNASTTSTPPTSPRPAAHEAASAASPAAAAAASPPPSPRSPGPSPRPAALDGSTAASGRSPGSPPQEESGVWGGDSSPVAAPSAGKIQGLKDVQKHKTAEEKAAEDYAVMNLFDAVVGGTEDVLGDTLGAVEFSPAVEEVTVPQQVDELGMDLALESPGRAFVTEVNPGSWAERTGIQVGDEVISLNGHPVTEMSADDVLDWVDNADLKKIQIRPAEVPIDLSGITQIAQDRDRVSLIQQPGHPIFKVAILQLFVRGQRFGGPDKTTSGDRYDSAALANGLRSAGMTCELLHYFHEEHDAMFDVLKRFVAVLVRIMPGHVEADGGEQQRFDEGLFGLQRAGVLVLPSPNVVQCMGIKDAAVKLGKSACGMAGSFAYYSQQDAVRGLGATLKHQPRVIKQNRGSSGEGVWIARLKETEYCRTLGAMHCDSDEVLELVEACDNLVEEHTFAEFMEFLTNGRVAAAGRWGTRSPGAYLAGGREAGACIVDQPFSPRIFSNGEWRCTMLQDTLFSVVHKEPSRDGFGAGISAGPQYTTFAPSAAEVRDLTREFTTSGLSRILATLGVARDQIPLLWTVNFVDGAPQNEQAWEEPEWVVTDINCTCAGLFQCSPACCTEERPGASMLDVPAEDLPEINQLCFSVATRILQVLAGVDAAPLLLDKAHHLNEDISNHRIEQLTDALSSFRTVYASPRENASIHNDVAPKYPAKDRTFIKLQTHLREVGEENVTQIVVKIQSRWRGKQTRDTWEAQTRVPIAVTLSGLQNQKLNARYARQYGWQYIVNKAPVYKHEEDDFFIYSCKEHKDWRVTSSMENVQNNEGLARSRPEMRMDVAGMGTVWKEWDSDLGRWQLGGRACVAEVAHYSHLDFTVHHLDYHSLTCDGRLLAKFDITLRKAIAFQAGRDVKPEHVHVLLSPVGGVEEEEPAGGLDLFADAEGVWVQARVIPPKPLSVDLVIANLGLATNWDFVLEARLAKVVAGSAASVGPLTVDGVAVGIRDDSFMCYRYRGSRGVGVPHEPLGLPANCIYYPLAEAETNMKALPTKTQSALEKMKTLILARFPSFAVAWRKLFDVRTTGFTSVGEFYDAMDYIKYKGDIVNLWKELNMDASGLVSLTDLDWRTGTLLGQFHANLTARFKTIDLAKKSLGLDPARGLGRRDFCAAVYSKRLVNKKDAEDLFHMLAEPHSQTSTHAVVQRDALTWMARLAHTWPRSDEDLIKLRSGHPLSGVSRVNLDELDEDPFGLTPRSRHSRSPRTTASPRSTQVTRGSATPRSTRGASPRATPRTAFPRAESVSERLMFRNSYSNYIEHKHTAQREAYLEKTTAKAHTSVPIEKVKRQMAVTPVIHPEEMKLIEKHVAVTTKCREPIELKPVPRPDPEPVFQMQTEGVLERLYAGAGRQLDRRHNKMAQNRMQTEKDFSHFSDLHQRIFTDKAAQWSPPRLLHAGQDDKILGVRALIGTDGQPTFNNVPPYRLFVSQVEEDTWAKKVGLKVGDELIEVNQVPCNRMNPAHMQRELDRRPLTITIQPDAERHIKMERQWNNKRVGPSAQPVWDQAPEYVLTRDTPTPYIAGEKNSPMTFMRVGHHAWSSTKTGKAQEQERKHERQKEKAKRAHLREQQADEKKREEQRGRRHQKELEKTVDRLYTQRVNLKKNLPPELDLAGSHRPQSGRVPPGMVGTEPRGGDLSHIRALSENSAKRREKLSEAKVKQHDLEAQQLAELSVHKVVVRLAEHTKQSLGSSTFPTSVKRAWYGHHDAPWSMEPDVGRDVTNEVIGLLESESRVYASDKLFPPVQDEGGKKKKSPLKWMQVSDADAPLSGGPPRRARSKTPTPIKPKVLLVELKERSEVDDEIKVWDRLHQSYSRHLPPDKHTQSGLANTASTWPGEGNPQEEAWGDETWAGYEGTWAGQTWANQTWANQTAIR